MKMFQSRMTKSYSFKNSIRDFKTKSLAHRGPSQAGRHRPPWDGCSLCPTDDGVSGNN